jgi:hypothetical protein
MKLLALRDSAPAARLQDSQPFACRDIDRGENAELDGTDGLEAGLPDDFQWQLQDEDEEWIACKQAAAEDEAQDSG